MADEYQIEYEYSDGNTISIKADHVSVTTKRPYRRVTTRVDGTRVVTDPNIAYKVIACKAIISGDTANTIDSVQSGSITYSGAYPRLKKIYWDGSGSNEESNVEVCAEDPVLEDLGNGWWMLTWRFEEKDQ